MGSGSSLRLPAPITSSQLPVSRGLPRFVAPLASPRPTTSQTQALEPLRTVAAAASATLPPTQRLRTGLPMRTRLPTSTLIPGSSDRSGSGSAGTSTTIRAASTGSGLHSHQLLPPPPNPSRSSGPVQAPSFVRSLRLHAKQLPGQQTSGPRK
ncbi:unnamed protein product [Protopolystoma xenopodis]|uniref:Uncharacterized protein n=1 Tax=Protopolystoma xenopodis TaxID=117903 RepID=A0A448WXF2_9PLAT|nr:unnamed protein product [Protopolystoma xenopodis]